MIEKSNQPRKDDLVLGGQSPSPTEGAVLGGLEGVKRRLTGKREQQKIDALLDACQYGQAGLDLIIQALEDESKKVRATAYWLLQDRDGSHIKQRLSEYNSWELFECLYTIQNPNSIGVSVQADELRIVDWDGTVTVLNFRTGEEIDTKILHSSSIHLATFSPNGELLAGWSEDETIKIWNLTTGRKIHSLPKTSGVNSLSFSADGNLFAFGTDYYNIYIWDLEFGEKVGILSEWKSQCPTATISPNGKIIASVIDEGLKLWSLRTEEAIYTLPWHYLNSDISSVAFSPDGKILATGNYDSTIKLWKVEDGQEIHTLTKHSGTVWCVAISPDGKSLVSGSYDQTIKVWNLQTGQEICTFLGHLEAVDSVAISPDGQTLVSRSGDGLIKVWGVL